MESERVELQATGDAMSYSSSDDHHDGEALSQDETKTIMDFVENFQDVTKKMLDGPLDVDMNKLRIRGLLGQADILESRFNYSGAAECIEKAVECRSQARSLTPAGDAERAYHLMTLGTSLQEKFNRLGDVEDINKAIQLKVQAAQLTPEWHPNRRALINNLGNSYWCRFECLGKLADIDKAIECITNAVLLTPDGHADKPSCLSNLGGSYARRFERLDEMPDIDKAIECLSQAVLLTPDGHAHKPGYLSNLGNSYQTRFERLGELADIDKAIRCTTNAVLLTPYGHADKPSYLSNLGNSYTRRFQRLGELPDVEKAIGSLSQAVLLTPDGHADKPSYLNNLGHSYQSRFDRLGELADIEKAIECNTNAVLLTPDGHAAKTAYLNNLGNSYQSRFEHLGELADIEKAIECNTNAVLLTPDGHAGKPSLLSSLGGSYARRFRCLGELPDVDKAIECLSQAVLITPDGHARKPAYLSNLGASYQSRFERLGELGDIDKAIECITNAVLLTPDGHAGKPSYLSNLGGSYMRRFERLDEIPDADKAIECLSQAVLLTPDGHADKPSYLSNLGGSYMRRFERLDEIPDVGKAIVSLSQAVLLTPGGHAQKPAYLTNLGNSYQTRFERLGERPDIDEAIESQRRAVLLTPDGHADKPSRFNNLGNSYQSRFERFGELADIDRSIESLSQALLFTPDGHADKPGLFSNLGNSYQSRFKRLGQISDLECAQSNFQSGARSQVLNPDAQIRCARKWAKSSSQLGLSPRPAYERSMELVPHLIWLGSTIDQRYVKLASISDLATEAAAWAISAQLYDLAIEWLEEGRSIVWSQILQLRTPFDELSAVDPAMALHLKNLARQLEASSSRKASSATLTGPSGDLENDAQLHRRLAADWEFQIERARSIPGFENFMRPRKATELKPAAKDGPVVLINTHSTRWDALIIFPHCEDTAHIPLIELPTKDASMSPSQFNPGSVPGQRGDDGRGLILRPVNHGSKPEDPLKTLWSVVVNPILNALACTRKLAIHELPHVTWCATGALSFASLHAAGPYDGSSPNAFDLVVSSYVPSLSALLASSAPVTQQAAGVLAVGQMSTKDCCELPYTVHELAAIKQHAQAAHFLQLDGHDATVDAVLNAMDGCSWVHLACHATQNPIDPAHSAFHLHDGNLTLEAITKRQFKNKGLAFLSACQTAKGDSKLPNEAVHLAAGMLMAGYPSVIATMWSIYDIDGPEVAGSVYAELLKDGKMDHTQAARALHKAVAELRERIGVKEFKRWVPFIHIGV